MILYSNTLAEFKTDHAQFQLSEAVSASYEKAFHRKASPSEISSWENSLVNMYQVVHNAEAADDCGILIEYNLPNTSRRIDFSSGSIHSHSSKAHMFSSSEGGLYFVPNLNKPIDQKNQYFASSVGRTLALGAGR